MNLTGFAYSILLTAIALLWSEISSGLPEREFCCVMSSFDVGAVCRRIPPRGGGGQPLLPYRDLTVTAEHAMLVDGVLCEAATLVNGTTITRVPLSEFGENYTVYHVETEAHEIFLANGAPAENFVDNASRRAFDNFSGFERLHGDPPDMLELAYPRASNARHLPARIRARLGLDLRPRRSAS